MALQAMDSSRNTLYVEPSIEYQRSKNEVNYILCTSDFYDLKACT